MVHEFSACNGGSHSQMGLRSFCTFTWYHLDEKLFLPYFVPKGEHPRSGELIPCHSSGLCRKTLSAIRHSYTSLFKEMMLSRK